MALQPFAKQEGRWQLEVGHRGFHTVGNFDANGATQPLPGDAFFQGLYGHTAVSYDIFDSWSTGFFGDGGWVKSYNGFEERTAFYLNRAQLETQYLYRNPILWIAPTYQFTFPIYQVDAAGDEALVGEGALEHSAQLHVFKPWSKTFHSFGYMGYTYRNDGRSYQVPYGLGSRVRVQPVWLGLQMDGARTAMADQFTYFRRARTDVTNRVNARSLKYYSVNPEWTRVEVFGEWAPNREWAVRAGANMTVEGRSYANEFGWNIALTYAFGGNVDDPSFIPYLHQENALQKKKKRLKREFRMKREKEDPSLFQDDVSEGESL